MITLGLDIGSNSVGSAWIDTENKTIELGDSVFPAGVDEQENKRGAPKNQDRREKRSQRRNLARRAERKRRLRKLLVQTGLLPEDPEDLRKLLDANRWPVPTEEGEYEQLLKTGYTVWHLRRDAITRHLHPYELGRILVHLAQRRGAVGVETDPEDKDEGKVKKGMDRLKTLVNEHGVEATVGQLLADLIDERRQTDNGVTWNEPIRNRQYRISEDRMLFAGRELIREEFHRIVERQRLFNSSALVALLTDDLITQLDDPNQTDTWRHRGLLFGQRRTYWKTGKGGEAHAPPPPGKRNPLWHRARKPSTGPRATSTTSHEPRVFRTSRSTAR